MRDRLTPAIALGRGALPRVMTLAWSVARVQPCDQLSLRGRERPTFDLNLLDRVFQRQPFKFGQYELGERPIHNAQLGTRAERTRSYARRASPVFLLRSAMAGATSTRRIS
jgi:hypothetical protein